MRSHGDAEQVREVLANLRSPLLHKVLAPLVREMWCGVSGVGGEGVGVRGVGATGVGARGVGVRGVGAVGVGARGVGVQQICDLRESQIG